jgi:hypothetical protein
MPNFKKIDQVLDLAHRTGDKIIIVSEHHDPYVIMSVREYEGLLHGLSAINELSEEQLLDKINRDIAVWKASQENGDEAVVPDYDLDNFRVDNQKPPETEDLSTMAPDKADVNDATVEEEDKYYIEPVD